MFNRFSGANETSHTGISGERREHRRYDLKLDLRWKVIRRRKVRDIGTGQTGDVSRGGVCFFAGRDIPAGTNVSLSITWPVLLDSVTPMLLAVHGKVVRSSEGWVSIKARQYEFRTQGISRPRQESLNGYRTQVPLVAASTFRERLPERGAAEKLPISIARMRHS